VRPLPDLSYGIQREVPLGFGDTVAITREALAAQGFGVLTEIDVQATMKRKLDVDVRPYVILGACNPPHAYQALMAEQTIGLLLPCNVVVYEADAPGHSVLAVLDPVAQLGITGREDIRPLAEKVRALLLGVLTDVERRTAPATATS
jgi:uncharacterized protein (DUF302 family)